ncbi:MAG: GntR family transcriptional regulator [Planctomycetes bacterium]|nr:GntR family transcriptional regulator [Planctomycetota bacterium]
MLIALERNSGQPVFRQITDQVRFQVATGVLEAGSEIPSTRDLAARLGINPMTVSKAYAALEAEGVLERRPGLALVVRGRNGPAREVEQRAELARILRPAVAAARQLGMSAKAALDVYRKALAERGDNDEDV